MSSTLSPGYTEITSTRFSSPKRKRETEENNDPILPSSARMRTDLPTRNIQSEHEVPGSPRTRISKQMQSLNLRGHHSETPTRGLNERTEKEEMVDITQSHLGYRDLSPLRAKSTTLVRHSNPSDVQSAGSLFEVSRTPAAKSMVELPPLSTSNLEPPETPTLKPTTSPHPSLGPISPLPTTTMKPRLSDQDSPTPRNTLHNPSRRMRSPPPPSGQKVISDLVWDDSEITGHAPTDPADDGYGINGVGFRPTAAMAYDRAQRRKRQVADWKSREAREARMKRLERRRGPTTSLGPAESASRRVRFVEG